MKSLLPALGVLVCFAPSGSPQVDREQRTGSHGLLASSTDIANPLRGMTEYEPDTGAYRISGAGRDVWGTHDTFRYTWATLYGNARFGADLHIEAPVTSPLAKGMLMFRQNLDPGSPYADVALHADGHVTLQYRSVQGGETKDLPLPQFNPRQLRLVRQGDRFTAYAGTDTYSAAGRGVSIDVHMQDPVYVGLGVCSHNEGVLQNITFHDLALQRGTP